MDTGILHKIINAKRERVAAARKMITGDRLRDQIGSANKRSRAHAFRNALAENSGINIIAEFKRRSPSKGIIRADTNPKDLAKIYEQAGAAAISVLTEEDFFDGSLADLKSVCDTVKLTVLRKDFIVDEYQVWESAAAGADALLLIVAALTQDELQTFRKLTEDELGMDALVEVHSSQELVLAVTAGAKIIGVNNRDLRSFDVSLDVSEQLAAQAPPDVILISESGLRTHADLLKLRGFGYDGFLIGEALMRASDPGEALHSLLNG